MVEVDVLDVHRRVFQDVAWAQKGIDALKRAGLAPESFSIIAKESAEVGALIEATLGAQGERLRDERNRAAPRARSAGGRASGPARRSRRSSGCRERCGVSVFRRMTDEFSRL